jgi:hypothetical protein
MTMDNNKSRILDTLGEAPEARFTVLHKRVPLPHGKRQDNGLSEAFVASLDRSHLRVVRPGDPPALLSLAEAWTRLCAEDRRLAAAVAATVIHKRSVDDAAPLLGVSPSTANRRKRAGIAQLTIWTGLDELGVTCKVHNLTA